MPFWNKKSQQSSTAQIVPNQVFLDEGERFEPGVRYEVAVEKARYFFNNGWLEGSTVAPGEAKLDIDNSKLGHAGGF